jgi:predicted acetyltransferase
MAGIAAVAVGAEHRGRGVGAFLMQRELERLHAEGVALSVLYPATLPLYRRVGYELAGAQFQHQLAMAAIDVRDRSATLRRETPDDAPAIEALYCRLATQTNGNLDRTAFFWKRVRTFQGKTPAHGFVVEGASGLEGYVFVVKMPSSEPPSAPGFYTIHLPDIVAVTPAAARRLLTFLADHFAQADFVRWKGPAADPLALHLRESALRPTLREHWMLRIVHARAALEGRGYAAGVRGEVHLDLRDEGLPGNTGRIVLEVADGRGAARAGGRGEVRVDARGLAALYSGYFTPIELRQSGRLECADERACAVLGTVFSGPAPWMRDSF